MIVMGDYFDNVLYGIVYIWWVLKNFVFFLLVDVKCWLIFLMLNVFVFIVGNGFFLDGLIEIFKIE